MIWASPCLHAFEFSDPKHIVLSIFGCWHLTAICRQAHDSHARGARLFLDLDSCIFERSLRHQWDILACVLALDDETLLPLKLRTRLLHCKKYFILGLFRKLGHEALELSIRSDLERRRKSSASTGAHDECGACC